MLAAQMARNNLRIKFNVSDYDYAKTMTTEWSSEDEK